MYIFIKPYKINGMIQKTRDQLVVQPAINFLAPENNERVGSWFRRFRPSFKEDTGGFFSDRLAQMTSDHELKRDHTIHGTGIFTLHLP